MGSKGRIGVAALVSTAALLAVLPGTSSALTKTDRVSGEGEFLGDTCGTQDTAHLRIPWRGWSQVRAIAPQVGDRVDDSLGSGSSIVITDLQTDVGHVVWTGKDMRSPASCPPPGPFEIIDYSWYVYTNLVAEYQRRVKLHSLRAEIINQRALQKKFGAAFRHGYAYREKCRRNGSVRFRCRVSWVIGDGSYSGTNSVWLSKKKDKIRSNYRYRIRLIDEFCRATQDGSPGQCTKRYRGKGRL